MPTAPSPALITLRALSAYATLQADSALDTEYGIGRARVIVASLFDALATYDVETPAQRQAMLQRLVCAVANELQDARATALRDARNAIGKLQ